MALVVIVLRVAFRMLLDAAVRRSHVLFTLPEIPLPEAAAGHPHRRPGDARRHARRVVRRPAARDAAHLRRRGERARQPEAAAEVVPGALHEFGVAVTVALTFAPATRRERAARAPRPPAARRHAAAPSRRARDRHPRAARRARPVAPARGRHGLARLRPDRQRRPAHASAHRRAAAGGPVGVCVGRVRPARRDHAARARRADAVRSACSSRRPGSCCRAGGSNARVYRPDPWALAEWLVAACGIAAAVRHVRRGPRRSREPEPVAATAALARPAAAAGARDPRRRAAGVAGATGRRTRTASGRRARRRPTRRAGAGAGACRHPTPVRVP